MKTETQEKLCVIISDFTGHDESLSPSTKLIGDLNFDSLDVVELVMAIEAEFGIEIPAADYDSKDDVTIAEIGDYIESKTAKP